MASTPCPDDRTLLTAALGEVLADSVQAHLDACAECLRRVDQLRAEVHALRDAPSPAASLGASGLTSSNLSGEDSFAESPGATPAVIGKYPIVGRLGAGGQADIFRAVHPELFCDLVIKLARKPLDPGGFDHDRLAAEGRLLADLDHPNLVRIYDLGEHEGRPFLAMERVCGCTLGQHARECRPEPRRAALLIAELARAVAYLHARGVIHQDLKPANILVDHAGRPRLIDFGLARLRDAWAGDGDGSSGGTLAYMAPEQARGESERVGARSDVFALGAVLYFLLTGRPPFEGRDQAEVWNQARRGTFDRAAMRQRAIPRRLCRVVLKAMALEPEDRHATAGVLAAELESVFRRGHPVAALAFVSLLALGAVGGRTLWSRGPDPAQLAPPARSHLKAMIDLVLFESANLSSDEFAKGNPDRYDLHLHERRALPLGPRDWVRIEAKVDRPAYLYVIWIDTDGKATPLWPWIDGDWANRPKEETSRDRLTLPDSEGGQLVVPLTRGLAGVEALILLARDTPLDPAENMAVMKVLTRPRLRPTVGPEEAAIAIWLENGERVTDEPTRAPILSKARSIGDPDLQIRNMMKELRPFCPCTRAVCFGNRGDR